MCDFIFTKISLFHAKGTTIMKSYITLLFCATMLVSQVASAGQAQGAQAHGQAADGSESSIPLVTGIPALATRLAAYAYFENTPVYQFANAALTVGDPRDYTPRTRDLREIARCMHTTLDVSVEVCKQLHIAPLLAQLIDSKSNGKLSALVANPTYKKIATAAAILEIVNKGTLILSKLLLGADTAEAQARGRNTSVISLATSTLLAPSRLTGTDGEQTPQAFVSGYKNVAYTVDRFTNWHKLFAEVF